MLLQGASLLVQLRKIVRRLAAQGDRQGERQLKCAQIPVYQLLCIPEINRTVYQKRSVRSSPHSPAAVAAAAAVAFCAATPLAVLLRRSCGKTEIARRLAKLAEAPFIKVT
jgi:hypothetical protein